MKTESLERSPLTCQKNTNSGKFIAFAFVKLCVKTRKEKTKKYKYTKVGEIAFQFFLYLRSLTHLLTKKKPSTVSFLNAPFLISSF